MNWAYQIKNLFIMTKTAETAFNRRFHGFSFSFLKQVLKHSVFLWYYIVSYEIKKYNISEVCYENQIL